MKRLLTFAAFLLSIQLSFAAVHHVPGTYSTIQAALNACSTGDTVLVAPGTFYENITWPSTQGILLRSESGAALTVIDGGAITRVIRINTGVDNTTIIDGFTIKNGYGDAGGGLGITYSSPTIKNNIITQNTAYETPANLGGGGGIVVAYNSSPIIVDNVFTYNSATASAGGGILCAFNSHPIIDNNLFENNSAATGGGAIMVHNDCSATITNNTIRYNNSQIHGGGIYFQQANSVVQNNIIEYNTADVSGGGIGMGMADVSLIDNNIIRYNSADSTGGGIFCFDNSNGQIINNVLKHNEAKFGGGIHCYFYSNPVISGNIADSNKAVISGGGIRCKSYCSPQILDNFIRYNVAEDSSAGGISCIRYSSPEIMSNTLRYNTAESTGGAITCYDYSSPLIQYNSIDSNKVISGIGGGLFCGENSSPDILNNSFNGNSCSFMGGDIFAWWGCTVIIDGNEIHGSISSNSLFLVGTSSVVRYNFITNHAGSGIGLWADFSYIHNNEIAYNDSGGVVCQVGSNPAINCNNICDNSMYGVSNLDPTVTVNALNNWWGDSTGPYHSTLNPTGLCNAVSDYVLFYPWTTTGPWPVPVELTSFSATCLAGEVILNWTTATEVNNLGFEIERRIISSKEQGEWVRIGFKKGFGTTTEPKKYSFRDNISELSASSVAYRLKQIDLDGNFEYSDEVFVDILLPVGFTLDQNYPNPFNPATTISYSVPVKSYINLKVFNALGREVLTLVNKEQAAGRYQVKLNAVNLASGVYFYRLEAGSFSETKKMILLR